MYVCLFGRTNGQELSEVVQVYDAENNFMESRVSAVIPRQANTRTKCVRKEKNIRNGTLGRAVTT